MTAAARSRSLPWTDDKKAARLIAAEPLALLVGFLLDQQVPMEWAFGAPERLRERVGGKLSARIVAAMDPGALEQAFVSKPPLHRYPASMAKRTQKLCQVIVDEYGGDPKRLWNDGADGPTVVKRISKLPGFSTSKGQVIVGVLAKRLGSPLPEWEEVAPAWFSLADVDTPEALLKYREIKRAAKQSGNWPPR
ncbi:MAG: HhH-GPD-type base excision DNA repair protein [Candidatus Dormibacteria bacterium]